MRHIVIVGFGSIGQAIQPLLKQHFSNINIIVFDREVDASMRAAANEYGLDLRELEITPDNYRAVIGSLLHKGDFLLNLAVEVSSIDMIELAQAHQTLYMDAGIEPWAYQSDQQSTMSSNYELREQLLAFARGRAKQTTALVAHGANPGFINCLLYCALERMARKNLGQAAEELIAAGEWGKLAQQLGVRVIQISECDTQVMRARAEPGEFVCTWSVDGFIIEALQQGEAGWGSHEKTLPPGAQVHETGCRAAIMLGKPGANIKLRSWSPNQLEFEAFLITHNESISIADTLTVKDQQQLIYRPTVYYAYHPCDEAFAAMSLINDGTDTRVSKRRVIRDEIISGIDELGIFLISDRYPSLWWGSNLSIARTRALAKHNNATSLQAAAAIVAAMRWMVAHPNQGVIESDQLDHRAIFDMTATYWGPLVCEETDWKPSEDLQFASFLCEAPANLTRP